MNKFNAVPTGIMRALQADMWRLVLSSVLLLLPFQVLGQGNVDVFSLSELPAPQALSNLLWNKSPRLQLSRKRVGEASGQLMQSRLLPNPQFDFGWNTIPMGRLNPPELTKPLLNVPNYVFGLSELVELGKRGPRQRAFDHAYQGAVWETLAEVSQVYWDLYEQLATIATAEIRKASWMELAQDARTLTDLQQIRAQKGDAAVLDADRAALEEEKLKATLNEEEARLSAALRGCAEIVGMPCLPFGSADAARAFLSAPPLPSNSFEHRPDLQALKFYGKSAAENLSLAYGHALPDPTLRIGYVRDQFIISGNQQNSVFIGVSLPLTFFDHGQADAHQARAQMDAWNKTREGLIAETQAKLMSLEQERQALEIRRERLQTSSLPLARSVVQRLQEVVRRGGAPVADLLLARRTLGELIAASADVDFYGYHLAISEARLHDTQLPIPEALKSNP